MTAMQTCPACAATEIERILPGEQDDEGDELTADVRPVHAEAPNMRCRACGHRWWAPAASKGR